MLATVLAWFVAALHVGFGLMETIGWTRLAHHFGYSREATEQTRVLALNQGCYNIGIAALLAWALLTGQGEVVAALLIFVVAMGIVGAISARWTIFVMQALPALLALAAGVL